MKVNLNELFKVQRRLDAEIGVNHPSVEGEDRLAKRILALQVELGECANEWRGFKFWSKDQKPRYELECEICDGEGFNLIGVRKEKCLVCKDDGVVAYPLLEEYVDCLHFILSVGLEDADLCVWDWEYHSLVSWDKDITRQFIDLNYSVSGIARGGNLELTIRLFLGLGELLGFTWDQIESAYMSKNKTNWERQDNGY